MDHVKLVVIGDGHIGKTSLIITHTSGSFPHDYVPTVNADYRGRIECNSKPVSIGIWDTLSSDDYARLRVLSYPHTNVFIICFTVSNEHTLHNVTTYWVPEIIIHGFGAPFIIVGTRTDLRNEENMQKQLKVRNIRMVTTEEGIKVARENGAAAYVECSSLNMLNVSKVFETAIQVAFTPQKTKKKEKKGLASFIFRKKNITITPSKKLRPGEEELEYQELPSLDIPVYGHAVATVGDRVFIIGGSNENGEFNKIIFNFDLRKKNWNVIEGIDIPPLQFHSCVDYNSCIYIFGGKSNGYRNDCYKFDSENNCISKIVCNGSSPSPRYGHSAVGYNQKMYVFGGYDNQAMTCNDLFVFDFNTSTWEKIRAQGPAPHSRFLHSAVVFNKSMYIFGGRGDGSICYNDLYQFDFDTFLWTKLKPKGKLIPSARHSHASVTTYFGMYIVGGYDSGNNKSLSDSLFYDFATQQWRNVIILNQSIISPVFNHAAVWDPVFNTITVIGGKVFIGLLDDSTVHGDTFSLVIQRTFIASMIVTKILFYMNIKEVEALRIVNKELHLLCEDDKLWKNLCQVEIPFVGQKKRNGLKTYREHFYENYDPSMIICIP